MVATSIARAQFAVVTSIILKLIILKAFVRLYTYEIKETVEPIEFDLDGQTNCLFFCNRAM